MDYKNEYINFEEGKYPKPENRMRKSSFPDESELFTYGVDFPMPESMDDLRCEYREDERFPLVLEDLEGYRVPPFGLTVVSASGSGHKQGIIYVLGTFRKDMVRFGKEFGISPQAAVVIREEGNVKAMVEGISRSFEKHEKYTLDKRSSAAVYEAVAEVVMDKIFDDKTSREALKLLGMLDKMFFGVGDDNKKADKALDLAKESMNVVQDVLAWTEEKKGEIIEAEFIPPED